MATIPTVTSEQMEAVDRAMVEELGLDIRQIMETAGRQVAIFARRMLAGDPTGKRIAIVCGTGGNGGDGMVAARYLAGWGADVRVVLTVEPDPGRHAVAAHQLAVLRAMGLPIDIATRVPPADLVIDGLLGFSTRSAPTDAVAELIRATNVMDTLVLAIDLPSGLNATSGEPYEPTVRATATLTLGLPKTGLAEETAKPHVGNLWLADIGIPAAAYREAGIEAGPIFTRDEFIPLGGG